MAENSDQPVVLASCADEAEAALLVAALEARGIEAQITGALTSGFRAEVPGGVQVLVRRSDMDRATEALRDVESEEPPAGDDDEDSDDNHNADENA